MDYFSNSISITITLLHGNIANIWMLVLGLLLVYYIIIILSTSMGLLCRLSLEGASVK